MLLAEKKRDILGDQRALLAVLTRFRDETSS
jgi:hypothetical protein